MKLGIREEKKDKTLVVELQEKAEKERKRTGLICHRAKKRRNIFSKR